MSPAINAQISKYPMPFFLQYWQPLFATYNVYNTMKSGFACYKNYNTKESRNYNTNCIKLLIAPSFILLHPFLTFFFLKLPSPETETKKLEGKLDALVNLVTQLALNQKSVPITRVCGLCSSTDHHIDLCPSMQQSGAIEQPEAYVANIYNRPPQPQ